MKVKRCVAEESVHVWETDRAKKIIRAERQRQNQFTFVNAVAVAKWGTIHQRRVPRHKMESGWRE